MRRDEEEGISQRRTALFIINRTIEALMEETNMKPNSVQELKQPAAAETFPPQRSTDQKGAEHEL